MNRRFFLQWLAVVPFTPVSNHAVTVKTDSELAAAAWTELTKTTDPYPVWVKKGRPATSHWAKAHVLLNRIKPCGWGGPYG